MDDELNNTAANDYEAENAKLRAEMAVLQQQMARYAAALNAINATVQLVAQPQQPQPPQH